jgi:hypothetical protein
LNAKKSKFAGSSVRTIFEVFGVPAPVQALPRPHMRLFLARTIAPCGVALEVRGPKVASIQQITTKRQRHDVIHGRRKWCEAWGLKVQWQTTQPAHLFSG